MSNWDVSLEDVLGRVGLRELLDGVVTSAAAGARKPDPTPFRDALQLVGAGADEALHVGDSAAEDLAGARAAGIEGLLLIRDRAEAAPSGVGVIHSLDELAVHLDSPPR